MDDEDTGIVVPLGSGDQSKKNDLYNELLAYVLSDKFDPKQFPKVKIALAKRYNVVIMPTNFDLLLYAKEDITLLRKRLQMKPTRSISGVSPIAIMTKPSRCPHGRCTYCPGGLNSPFGDVPQSYTGQEPASMRGARNNYDAYFQVFNRLEQYVVTGNPLDKVEIIVMGGTFPAEPDSYQTEFIHDTFQALNDFSELFYPHGELEFERFKSFFELPGELGSPQRTANIHAKLLAMKRISSVEEEQIRNETVKARCVALCIETKPDWGFIEHGNRMLEQGCTRVELGIQTVYDDVLQKTHRGHTLDDSFRSIQLLRDLGFKVNFHYMLGLPDVDFNREVEGIKQLFSDERLLPDMIKVYPTMVAPGTALFHQYKQGKFVPLTAEQAAERIVEVKKRVPEYCRIQRIHRDVPTKQWTAGVEFTNLRQFIHQKYKLSCRCIRCREPKGKSVDVNEAQLKIIEYKASGGKEFFIAMEHPPTDTLLGFCRLRFPGELLRSEITKTSALIRELHVYGNSVPLGESGSVQHKGLGKILLQYAERIASENGYNKLVVISGVGAREYYRKQGYTRENVYMVKLL